MVNSKPIASDPLQSVLLSLPFNYIIIPSGSTVELGQGSCSEYSILS